MLRYYYIADRLESIKKATEDLKTAGIDQSQFRVLSEEEAKAEKYHLDTIADVLDNDAVHKGPIGALIGLVLAILVLVLAPLLGLTDSVLGWTPFIFLAIVILGFATWEAGMIGIHQPNRNFKRFRSLLKQGKHVVFVDIEVNQEAKLTETVSRHPDLRFAGASKDGSKWVVEARKRTTA